MPKITLEIIADWLEVIYRSMIGLGDAHHKTEIIDEGGEAVNITNNAS